ncbi:MAG: hypothetical protein NC115_12005 [Bacteroidales bacterium]|nr:hypothetical protein [Bacteroidales bacterium]
MDAHKGLTWTMAFRAVFLTLAIVCLVLSLWVKGCWCLYPHTYFWVFAYGCTYPMGKSNKSNNDSNHDKTRTGTGN